jgi:hypothetical protein
MEREKNTINPVIWTPENLEKLAEHLEKIQKNKFGVAEEEKIEEIIVEPIIEEHTEEIVVEDQNLEELKDQLSNDTNIKRLSYSKRDV